MANLIVTNASGNQITLVVDKGNYGPSGYSGQSGYSGYSGFSGIGSSGFSGVSGYSGYSGASGLSGFSGSGVSGYSGYSGYSGSGTSGYSGFSGYSGMSGASTSGYSGYSGASGFSGSGVSGYSGYSGSGISGYSGYSGLGLSGYSGFSGASGKSGFSGSGVSGYSGYSGSGISGFSGYSGAVGAQGTSGFSGYSGYSGSGVSGYSGYSGSGVSGFSGYSGAVGQQGESGFSGYSGYSGSGISGYSGYSGSGVSGYSGFSGTSGYSGESIQGESGFSGFSGDSGYSGFSGDSGFSGSGVSGFSGFSGFSGSGVSGFSGFSGYSGESIQGESGYSGFSGESGFSGISGFSGSGISGYSGYSGSGISGYSGYSGESIQGESGFSGFSGYSGISGFSGFSGIGISGYSGYSGYSGLDGIAQSGISGYSGYSGFSGFSGSGVSGFSGYSGSGVSGFSGYSGFSGLGLSGYSGYSGYSGAAGLGGTVGAYGSFYDTTNQTAAINTPTAINLNSTDGNNNVELISASQWRFNVAGTFSITYSLQLTNTSTALGNIQVWLRKNGTNIADSSSHFDVPDKQGSSFSSEILTVNYVVNVAASDVLQLFWQTGNTAVTIETLAASGTYPRTPSVILTATQVMYTQSGYSGISGFSGYSGISGQNGANGTSGYSGYSGSGVSGFSGYSGYSGSGISGFSGYSGSGISGFSGYSGANGADGTSGYSGFSGAVGADGASGFSGYSGYSGSGVSGYSGYSGSGISGFSGFSGYSGASSGGGGFEVGQVVMSASAPATGTWLQTGKYYSTSTYPTLATKLGSVPDIGTVTSYSAIPTPFAISLSSNATYGYASATNGTRTVVVGYNGASFSPAIKTTLNTSAEAWVSAPARSNSSSFLVRYINSNFVAVNTGSLVISPDGLNWNNYNTVTQAIDVAYGSSKYVVVRGNSSPNIQYSSDLITWTNATYPASINAGRIIFANSLFVIANAQSYISSPILTSPDGITWTAQTSTGSAAAPNAVDVIYANSLFVAVGSNFLYTSTDGVTWTSRTPAGSPSFTNVNYVNGLYIAVGLSGIVYTSSNGTTWTLQTTGTTQNLFSSTWSGTTYLICGANGYYLTSTNGTSWTLARDISYSNFYSATTINGKAIAFGDAASPILAGGTRKDVLPTGVWNWACTTSLGANNYKMFAYNGSNQYIAVGDGGKIIYSSDALTWSPVFTSNTTVALYSAAYLNGRYLVGGAAGTTNIVTSTNGTTWSATTKPTSGDIYAFAYGASRYVAVGANSTNAILYSTDALTWSAVTTGPAVDMFDVAFGNSVFVAVGTSGAIFSSSDGVTWTTRSAGANTFNKVIYANSLFVAVGAAGRIYTSPDGATWTLQTSGTSNQLNDIVWSGTTFCIVGNSGTVLTSTNGTTWTLISPSGGGTLNQVFWDGTKFVACVTANGSGIVWYSSTGATWKAYQTVVPISATAKYAYLGGKFIGQQTSFVQSSSDAKTWTLANAVAPVAQSITNTYKLGGMYYALSSTGLFQSSDGDTFTYVANSPVRQITAMAYGNGIWLFAVSVTSSPNCEGYYTSTDGVNFTKSSDAQDITIGGTTSSGLTDVVFGNGNFVRATSVSATLGLTAPIFTSPDGITWTARLQYTSNLSSPYIMASDGTNILLTSVQLGLVFLSTDGGITWSSLFGVAVGVCMYSNGAWFIGTSTKPIVATDTTTFNALSAFNAGVVYSNGNYVYGLTNDGTTIASFGVSMANANGAGVVFSAEKTTTATVLFNSSYTKAQANTSTNILAPIVYTNRTGQNGNVLAKIPLYSYNTSTTFYIPPSNASGGQLSYMYAGA